MSVQVIAEIGQNHSGSLDTALEMVAQAKMAGADFVKFQRRTVELAVPRAQWDAPRETPWGVMPYLEYRKRLEFGEDEYLQIDIICRNLGIPWFVSVWDVQALESMSAFQMPYVKIPSAKLTDYDLLEAVRYSNIPSILSTGMSTPDQIDQAIHILRPTVLMHCTSTYPSPPEELNLRCIQTLRERYHDVETGYSGHEVGLATTVAAVALGATWVERHVTLDRSSWGTDQAASVEFPGLKRLVKDIRNVEIALGDGIKKVEPGEWEPMMRLRGG